jgi:hypothetical protein
VSISAEVSSLRKLQSETKRLYELLQSSVDEQLRQAGFLPSGDYGMINDGAKPNGSTAQPAHRAAESAEAWGCSDRQRAFIEKIAKREKFTSEELDGIAQTTCQARVQQLDKRQASQFISELLKLSTPLPYRKRSKRQAPAIANGEPA